MRENFFIMLAVIAGKDKNDLNVLVNIGHIVAITSLPEGCEVVMVGNIIYKCKNNFEDMKRRCDQYGLLKVV